MEKGDKAPNEKGIFGVILRFYYYVGIVSAGIYFNFLQIMSPHKKMNVIPQRAEENAIVTGGARGIGLEIVKQLLLAKMRVIVGCRDIETGNKAIQSIRDDGIITGTAECISLDLQFLDSVRDFAEKILNLNIPIHVLINNAGVMFVPYKLTTDGFETSFQVNYLGHFLLTNLLLPALVKGGTKDRHSRIINVSSTAHALGTIDFNDLLMEKYFSLYHTYGCTKLMQIVSSMYFDHKFQSEHLPIRAYSVHPGMIYTGLYANTFGYKIFDPFQKALYKKTEKGADGVVFVALSPEMENQGGTYITNCTIVKPRQEALNTEVQSKLWEISCDLVKLDKSQLQSSILPNSFTTLDIE